MGVVVVLMWLVFFVGVFIANFFVKYNEMQTYEEHMQWLCEKCEDEDFFKNIQAHSTLCEDARQFNKSDIVMVSMTTAFESTPACLIQPCQIMINSLYDFLQTHVWSCVIPCVFLFVILIVLLRPILLENHLRSHENVIFAMQRRHTLPMSTKFMTIS